MDEPPPPLIKTGTDEPANELVVESVKPWDLANKNLQDYFDQNLEQVKWIYWVSVVVMIAGLVLVAVGVYQSWRPNAVPASLVGAGAGILTEFIGATFMWMYRSTLEQASSNMSILERINRVAMADEILTSGRGIQDEGLRDSTRAEIAKILLIQGIPSAFQKSRNVKVVKPKARAAEGPS
jgi:hypothetical protein